MQYTKRIDIASEHLLVIPMPCSTETGTNQLEVLHAQWGYMFLMLGKLDRPKASLLDPSHSVRYRRFVKEMRLKPNFKGDRFIVAQQVRL